MPLTDITLSTPSVEKILAVIKNTMQKKGRVTVGGCASDAFVYILDGACHYLFANGTSLDAQTGDVLYLASGAVYEMTLQTPRYEFIYVDFTFSSDEQRKCAVFRGQSTDYAALFRGLFAAYTRHTPEAPLTCMRYLYSIYEGVCKNHTPAYVQGELRARMARAKAEIELRFSDPDLNISALAKTHEISEVYFRKAFATAFGVSPKKYIVAFRVEKAKQFLAYPFFTLTECAARCGFSSRQYFSKVFLAHTGETPAAYRKKHLRKGDAPCIPNQSFSQTQNALN